MDIDDVISQQTHLDTGQKDGLRSVLSQYDTLFDGSLGHYKGKKVHIDLDKSVPPKHFKSFPVPKVHMDTF